jgi:hypothetical protein
MDCLIWHAIGCLNIELNICYKSLLRRQSHTGDSNEARTAIERKTSYGFTCWRYVVVTWSANQWALELP